MLNSIKNTIQITFLLLTLFMPGIIIADMPDISCSLLPQCGCLLTTDKVFEYHCPNFMALLKYSNNLIVKCDFNDSTDQSYTDFIKVTSQMLQMLTLTDCSTDVFLSSTFTNLKSVNIVNTAQIIKQSRGNIENFVKSLPNLTELQISFYKINLTNDLFRNNRQVQKLDLAHNLLTHQIPEAIFESMTKLEHLDLSNNNLTFLPDSVFLGLRALKYLNLRMNKLTDINSLLFYDLQSLEKIDLSHNEIIGIHIEAFQRLVSLKHVNLSNNFVEFDGFSPFYGNLNLENIDLSHNRLTHMVNDLVINKIVLEKLDLSFNDINYVELSNIIAVSLQPTIDLQNNKISSINFNDVELMEQLNQIETSELTHDYHAVTTVNLNNNPITCDCSLYSFIKFLTEDDKSIQFILNQAKCFEPKYLHGVPLKQLKLESLVCKIENNCPKECNCNYRQWDKTMLVNCANRNLTYVPKLQISTSKNLHKIEVYLQENLLTSGPQKGMGYEDVTKLILSHNQILNVTWIPSYLEVLDIEYNALTSLNDNVLIELNSPILTNINLGNNPWKCDCSTLMFNSFLITELNTKQIDISKIQCEDNKKLLVNLNSSELCSLSTINTTTIAIIISLVVLGLSGVIIFIILYNSKKNARPKRSRMV